MTISTDTATASYTGNGTTQIFPIPFYFLVDTDIKVSQKVAATGVISVLTLNSDYTLTGAGNQAGGSATFVSAPASGDQIFIERNVDAVQETAYPENGIFPAASHEKALDRLTMLVQQILSKLTFGLFRDPLANAYDAGGNTLSNLGDAVDAQDAPTLAQVQTLVAGAAGGLTPADIALYSVLNDTTSGNGAERIAIKQQGTGAVASNIKAVLLGFFYTPQMFGAKGDDTTDDTTAIQNWINACGTFGFRGYVPAVASGYKLTSTITITAGVQILGDGCEPFIGTLASSGVNTRGRGSWFHIAHAGKGFTLGGTGVQRNGVLIQGIGTYRDQPTPNGGAYTPGAFDYDFNIDTCDVTLRDVMLLNPTKGVYHTGGYGRLTCENIRGQPLSIGTNIDGAADMPRLKGIHWWPFWTNDTGVRAYTLANGIAHKFYRCDDPVMEDCFCIGYSVHTWVGQSVTYTGSTGNLRMTDCFADLGGALLYVDSAAVGANVVITSGVCFGTTTTGAGSFSCVTVNGTSCQVQISNSRLFNAQVNAIRNGGSGNGVLVTNVYTSGWNQGNTGAGAYHNDSGVLQLDSKPNAVTGANSGPLFSGSATSAISVGAPLASGAGSVTTDASGFATITHNANVSPRKVWVQTYAGSPYFVQPTGTVTATTFQIRVWQQSGAVLASTALNVFWRAEY